MKILIIVGLILVALFVTGFALSCSLSIFSEWVSFKKWLREKKKKDKEKK